MILSISLFCASLWMLLAPCRGQSAIALTFLHVECSAGQNYSLAVLSAVEDINRNGVLLQGHVLSDIATTDAQCSGENNAVRESLERELSSDTVEVVAVISGCCETVTETISSITSQNNIVLLSYSPNLGELSQNGSQNVFHLFPSQMDPTVIAAVLNFHGWRRVAVLTEQNRQIAELEEALPSDSSVDVIFLESGNWSVPLEALEEGTRVIVLNTHPQRARTILCQAFNMGLYHPEYVWITPGWYGNGWWKVEGVEGTGGGRSLGCTQQQLEMVLNRSLAVTMEAQRSNSTVGQTLDGFHSEYLSAIGSRILLAPPLAAYAYDAVWTLAVALNSTGLISIDASGMESSGIVSQTLTRELQRISFVGITGLVEFDSSGRRVASLAAVHQYREANGSLVAVEVGRVEVGGRAEFMYLAGEDTSTLWPGGLPPRVTVINTLAIPLSVVYYILTTAGILYGVLCIVFNFVFRKRKIVQLSSPKLNYLICAGAIILLSSVYFITFPSRCARTFEVLCMANVWLAAIGGSLQYGTMQAKTFRVYLIFHRPLKKKTVILKDWQLALYVLILVIIDLVMLTIATSFPDARSIGRLVQDQENPPSTNADGVTQVAFIYDCQSRRAGLDTYWLVPLFGYKLILQFIATVLALLLCTVQVRIKTLDDSRYTQAITYVNMVVLALAVALAFAVNNFENAKAAVNGMIVLVAATFNLSMVFIPYMISLYKDPNGKKLFRETGHSIAEASVHRVSLSSTTKLAIATDSEATTKPKVCVRDEGEITDSVTTVRMQENGEAEMMRVPYNSHHSTECSSEGSYSGIEQEIATEERSSSVDENASVI